MKNTVNSNTTWPVTKALPETVVCAGACCVQSASRGDLKQTLLLDQGVQSASCGDLKQPLLLDQGQSLGSLVCIFLGALPAMQETRVRSLGREDPLEEEMATHSCSCLENSMDGGAW